MKSNIIIALGIIIILLGIFIYKDANIQLSTDASSSYILQENIKASGYDKDTKIFDIHINQVKQKNYHHILYANTILDGTVYNDNEISIITDIKGNGGRINTTYKSILVTNNVTATIHPTTSKHKVFVESHGFKYNHTDKISKFYNKAALTIQDKLIETSEFNYINDTEILTFNKGFKLISKHSETETAMSTLDINQSLIQSSQNVKTTYSKAAKKEDSDQIKDLLKEPTVVTASKMNLRYSDHNHTIVNYKDNIEVKQKGKRLNSDRLNLNFQDDHYRASQNVSMIFDNLMWSIKKERQIKNKGIRDMLNSRTTIKTNAAEFSPDKNILIFKGKIRIKQDNFKLTADHFLYDINSESITISGNVNIYKFGVRYLSTTTLFIDIPNETFVTDSKNNVSEITIEL